MNKIEKLIYEHCPDGVEFKALGEVCKQVSSGGTPLTSNSSFYNGDIPWLRTQEVDWIDVYDTKIKITEDAVEKSSAKWITKNCVIVAMYGATAAKVCINKIPLTTNQACCNLDIDEGMASYRYVFHWLSKNYDKLKSLGEGTQSNLNAKKIKKFKIPIPPLPIQQEIVKILDKFTQLAVELEAELTARKKQYEYYRDKLLSFGGMPERGTQTGDVEWKTLGEIGEIIRGNGLQKKDFTETGVGCIHYGQIYTYYGTFADTTKTFVSPELSKKLKKAQKGDVLIAGVSENIEDVCKPLAWLGDEICISGDMFVFRHNQNTKFITYLLQTNNFQKYKKRHAQGAKVTRVKSDKILKFKIPIPPLSKQKEIVAILDKFDALVNDISVGLPAEIAARKKQYEYYRNKLLTFQPIIDNQKNESQSKKQ